METELLKIFDDNRKQIGVAPRDAVHRSGYWHETFQCWFISTEQEKNYIYLQLRSHLKKDYPNLLDITAAGHLLANETIEDGVREIKEELGVEIPFHHLTSLGIIETVLRNGDSIDRELGNVFLYKTDKSLNEYQLQEEEVAGIVKIDCKDFSDLWKGQKEKVNIKGFQIKKDGSKTLIDEDAGRERFVPHPIKYYGTVMAMIEKILLNLK